MSRATEPTSIAAPQQGMAAFARAINEADLDAATACFARDACLITPDATAIRGREAIRPLLAQLIARRTEIAVEASGLLPAGDIALVRERWTIHSDGAGGARFTQSSTPTLILRRIDGAWKLAIAAPWGWGS